jgi:hypothetical protein
MILAFGCSVAHGIDTVIAGNSEENLECSYPNLIAKHLKVECESWAFAGNSNENIFHQFMENVPKFNKEITAVIVGWTSPMRETWVCNGRIWQFIPSWCASSLNVMDPYLYYKNYDMKSDLHPRICVDDENTIDVCERLYKFLFKYKFDEIEYHKKRQSYVMAIRSYCSLHGIKLIETTWDLDGLEGVNINIGDISSWVGEGRHPTKEEHKTIANIIINHYNL